MLLLEHLDVTATLVTATLVTATLATATLATAAFVTATLMLRALRSSPVKLCPVMAGGVDQVAWRDGVGFLLARLPRGSAALDGPLRRRHRRVPPGTPRPLVTVDNRV